MVNENRSLAAGDQVLVPWGFDEVAGRIVEIYESGLGPRARVRLSGDADSATVTVPLDSLLRNRSRPTIASGAEYERLVEKALKRTAADLNLSTPRLGGDSGADFELGNKNGQVLIQVKHYSSNATVSTDVILAASGLAHRRTGVLIVSNAQLAPTAEHRLDMMVARMTRLAFARWRRPTDDSELARALGSLLGPWT